MSIGQPLGEGQIYDSNRYTIGAMLARLECDAIDMGVVPDVPDALEQAFRAAAEAADVVITSGGVSVGEADYVKALLDRLGEVVFWKIAMKPGRPLAYGRIGGAHFFGLPGNPVSVMVTFYQFVRDALLPVAGLRVDRARADVQGDARRADPQGARPHGVPARHPHARAGRLVDGAHDRRPGFRHPVVDVARELLRRAADRRPATRRSAPRSTCSRSKA